MRSAYVRKMALKSLVRTTHTEKFSQTTLKKSARIAVYTIGKSLVRKTKFLTAITMASSR